VLAEDYIVSKFYQYAGYPRYNRLSKSYNAGCPTCREGSSWGKKRRLYFVPRKNLVFCHNCGLSLNPCRWIQKVADMSYGEVLKENSQFNISLDTVISKTVTLPEVDTAMTPTDLPEDAINLYDKDQVEFYKNNSYVKAALDVINNRKLDIAINKPKTLWLSLSDKIHKNRLIIPFYDLAGKIIHYQTRTIIENKKAPKYLSKVNSEKSLFGVDRVNGDLPYLFVTEGPIDAFFIENGVAVAGINEGKGSFFTDKQKNQLKAFPFHDIVWVLDNQFVDSVSKKKSAILARAGYKLFIWPEKFRAMKDLNEVAIKLNIEKIPTKFILQNVYSGVKANIVLSNLN